MLIKYVTTVAASRKKTQLVTFSLKDSCAAGGFLNVGASFILLSVTTVVDFH